MFDLTTINTGLQIPADCTEEQFFEWGKALANFEHGLQWAIGDWYNAIRWGDKQAACDRAGLNYKSAHTYGVVAERFKIAMRIAILGFLHHQILAIADLSDAQRLDLLAKAVDGDLVKGVRKPWTVARLRQERDRLLGRPDKPPVPEFDDRVEEILAQLPATASKKLRKEIAGLLDTLKVDFQVAVERETKKQLEKRIGDEQSRMLAVQKEIEQEKALLDKRAAGITPLMTKDEFKLIRSLLHPDKHPNGDKALYDKAFSIFNRLQETISPLIPIKVLRARGWD